MSRFLLRFTSMMLVLLIVLPGGKAEVVRAESDSQTHMEWSREYGSWSAGEGVLPTSDGGYLALGSYTEVVPAGEWDDYEQQAYIMKLSPEGEVKWEQRLAYGGSSTNEALSAIETRDGGYLVYGTSTNQAGEPYSQMYLAKLDADGGLKWDRTQDDPYIYSTPKAAVELEDGSFVIGGKGISKMGYETAYALKVDGQGQELWYNKYRYAESQYFDDLIPAVDGGLIAVGAVNTPEYEAGDPDALLIVKLNADGQEVWSKQISDPHTDRGAFAVIPAGDEGYLIGSQRVVDQQRITILTKTDLNGEPQWEKTFKTEGSDYEVFNNLIPLGDGYALLGGHYSGSPSNRKIQYDVLTVDRDGNLLNRHLFKEAALSRYGIGAAGPDGGVIVPGTVLREETTKFQLIKVAPFQEQGPADDRKPTSIAFSGKELKLKEGETVPSVLEAVYEDGSHSDLSTAAVYSIEDASIAEADPSGRVIGVSRGKTYLLAEFQGLSARIKVQVLPKDSDEFDKVKGRLQLDSDEYSLAAGTQIDIRLTVLDYLTGKETDVTKQAKFRSENPDIADIDAEGNLVGKRAGSTTIYAFYKGSHVMADVQVMRSAGSER
ncbi:Ig-like domain-containing protein [Paenibacillus cineris]|uniref:Ig-like domain-containing protein n=1 Tax=Paenibacillus cineris TaxID=237530 RepID=UPI001BB42924|nr:Ig-like domain-containing protein [Paenibacillus cineris]